MKSIPARYSFKIRPSPERVMLSIFYRENLRLRVHSLISKFREAIKERKRNLGKDILLHAIFKIGCKMVEHSPHSPDLAPSDYPLFPKLKEQLVC